MTPPTLDRATVDPLLPGPPNPIAPRQSRSVRRIVYGITVILILMFYSYPALRTVSTTGSRRLPVVSAPDLGLYLSMSRLERHGKGEVLEPYYRLGVPDQSLGFLKFRLGPILFGLLTDLLGGTMWWALFVWNLFWWGSLCLAAIWLFDGFLPHAHPQLVLAGVSLLMLFNFAMAKPLLLAWTHLPSLSAFEPVLMTYVRAFFPQMVIPLVLCYVGLQIRALQTDSMLAWGLMACLQFFAFAAFPYATVMMAGTTAVAVVWYCLSGAAKSAWRTVVGYFLVCACADLLFLLRGSSGLRTGSPDQLPLIHLQLSLLPSMIGKLWVVIGLLVVGTAVRRTLAPEVRWTLVGLGLTNMLLLLGDAVIPETTLMISDHAGYFIHSTIVTLLIFLASSYAHPGGRMFRVVKIASLAVLVLCLLTGAFQAEANYRKNLPANWQQADMATWFGRGEATPHDLVITQYDVCAWVPLLSDAEVLYCRNAQCLLTPEQNLRVQRFREVLYLYFEGRDRQWLETTTGFTQYGFFYEVFLKGDRDQRVAQARAEILPLFASVERRDPAITEFFHRYRRVWIVQSAQGSGFDRARLNSYLDLGNQEKVGNLLVTTATPK